MSLIKKRNRPGWFRYQEAKKGLAKTRLCLRHLVDDRPDLENEMYYLYEELAEIREKLTNYYEGESDEQ